MNFKNVYFRQKNIIKKYNEKGEEECDYCNGSGYGDPILLDSVSGPYTDFPPCSQCYGGYYRDTDWSDSCYDCDYYRL